jgi:hypothetical protein
MNISTGVSTPCGDNKTVTCGHLASHTIFSYLFGCLSGLINS